MEITPIGYVLLPIGLLLLLFRPRMLFHAVIFFSPFAATALINLPSVPFGFQPYHYFGVLLVVHVALGAITTGRMRIARSHLIVVLPLVLFWLAAAASLFNARLLPDGEITGSMAAQLAHLGLGISVALALAMSVNQRETVRSGITTLIVSAIVVSLWGFVQLACQLLGIEYPWQIFNNSVGASADGYRAVLVETGLQRVSSVSTEPSFLSRFLLAVAIIILALILEGRPIGSRRAAYAQLGIIATCLILTTSTTAIIGLLAMVVLLQVRYIKRLPRLWIILLVAALALVAALVAFPTLPSVIFEVTVQKVDTFSFTDRTGSIGAALDAFARSPLLGFGLGSITSHDLVGKILSNLGMIGLLLFTASAALILIVPGRGAARTLASNPTLSSAEREALKISLADVHALKLALFLMLITDLVAGFSYTYGQLWVVVGLLLASAGESLRIARAVAPRPAPMLQPAAAAS